MIDKDYQFPKAYPVGLKEIENKKTCYFDDCSEQITKDCYCEKHYKIQKEL